MSDELDTIENAATEIKNSFMKDIIKKTKLRSKSEQLVYDDTIFDALHLPAPFYDEFIESFKPSIRHLIKRGDDTIQTSNLNYIKLVSIHGYSTISLMPILETYIDYKLHSDQNKVSMKEFLANNVNRLVETTNKATRDLIEHIRHKKTNTSKTIIDDNAVRNFFMKIISIVEYREEIFQYETSKQNLLINFSLDQKVYTDLNTICSIIGLNKIIIINRPADTFNAMLDFPNVLIGFETNNCVYLIETNTSLDSKFNEITVRNKSENNKYLDDIELSSEGLTLLEMLYFDNGLIVLEPKFEIKEPIPPKRCNKIFKAILLSIPLILIASITYLAL